MVLTARSAGTLYTDVETDSLDRVDKTAKEKALAVDPQALAERPFNHAPEDRRLSDVTLYLPEDWRKARWIAKILYSISQWTAYS